MSVAGDMTPRIRELLEELASEIQKAQEAGETSIHSWAFLTLQDGPNSAVNCGGCLCPACMQTIADLAQLHAESMAAEHAEKPKQVH